MCLRCLLVLLYFNELPLMFCCVFFFLLFSFSRGGLLLFAVLCYVLLLFRVCVRVVRLRFMVNVVFWVLLCVSSDIVVVG